MSQLLLIKTTPVPDKHLSEGACVVAVDELLRASELEVHVAVGRDEEALVLVAPLKLHHDGFPHQRVEEGLRVHRHIRHLVAVWDHAYVFNVLHENALFVVAFPVARSRAGSSRLQREIRSSNFQPTKEPRCTVLLLFNIN